MLKKKSRALQFLKNFFLLCSKLNYVYYHSSQMNKKKLVPINIINR